MSGFRLQPLGMLMEPGNPREVEGVLTPAAVPGSENSKLQEDTHHEIKFRRAEGS